MPSSKAPSTDSETAIDTGEPLHSGGQERFELATPDQSDSAMSVRRFISPVIAGTAFFGIVLTGAYSVHHGTETVPVAGRDVAALQAMYGLALVLVGQLVVGRVYASLDRTKRVLDGVRTQPLVLVSSVYITALFVIGSVAPFLVSHPDVQPTLSFQPPAWGSVSDVVPPTCHGSVSDGQCRGTMSYLLGTNFKGEDLLAISALGLNTTLQVAITASVLTATLGITAGVMAGYFGGRADEILMRYVDVQRALPAFFVYILLILRFERSYPLMILVFGLLSWGGLARLVRSEVSQLRTTPFVRAARQSGAGSSEIIGRHILPALAGTVLTALAVLFAKFVLYEASLAFLSLSDVTVTSLGNELSGALGREGADPVGGGTDTSHGWWLTPWIIYVPAGILGTLLLAVSLVGDNVQEILDPRI